MKGKKIVLGITGSIAAYKACLIIRGLVKKGAEVQVVITPAGKEFITPINCSLYVLYSSWGDAAKIIYTLS